MELNASSADDSTPLALMMAAKPTTKMETASRLEMETFTKRTKGAVDKCSQM